MPLCASISFQICLITMKTFRGFIVGFKTHTYNIIKPLSPIVKIMLHQGQLFLKLMGISTRCKPPDPSGFYNSRMEFYKIHQLFRKNWM